MVWGQEHTIGAGSTNQIEDAHRAFDVLHINPGPLALRAMAAVALIDRLHEKAENSPIVNAIDAIREVINTHAQALLPSDEADLLAAIGMLTILKESGLE